MKFTKKEISFAIGFTVMFTILDILSDKAVSPIWIILELLFLPFFFLIVNEMITRFDAWNAIRKLNKNKPQ